MSLKMRVKSERKKKEGEMVQLKQPLRAGPKARERLLRKIAAH